VKTEQSAHTAAVARHSFAAKTANSVCSLSLFLLVVTTS